MARRRRAPRRAARACRPRPRAGGRARGRRAPRATAAATPPAAATWLSLIMAPSNSPKRCGRAAAVHHRLLLEGAQAGRGLARGGDTRLRAGRLGHVARRERGHAAQAAQEVEAGALGGQHARPAGRAARPACRRRQSARRRRARNLHGERRVHQPRRLRAARRCPTARRRRAPRRAPGRSPSKAAPGEIAVAGQVLGQRARPRPGPRPAASLRVQTGVIGRSPPRAAGRRSVMWRCQCSSSALGEVLAQVHAARLFAQQRALGDLRRPSVSMLSSSYSAPRCRRAGAARR